MPTMVGSSWWCDLENRYKKICEGIFSLGMYHQRSGVELMTELLSVFEHPQRGLHIVHIAGTNGKGSTAFYTASILREAGYDVGLYTSPHLVEPTERIRINGSVAAKDEFAAVGEEILKKIRDAAADATTSDVLLLMALVIFRRHGCRFAVIETGLGGSRDSTNALIRGGEVAEESGSGQQVTCITRIGLDHTAILGKTLQEIASNKAGILKKGTLAVLGENAPEVLEVLETYCRSRNISYWKVQDDPAIFSCLQKAFPSAFGTYQRENMANAMAIAERLSISPNICCKGIEKTVIPGRLQWIQRTDASGTVLLDGAHNPQGANALAESLLASFPKKRFACVIGIVNDKDVEGILQPMLPMMEAVYLVPTGPVERRLSTEVPAEFLRQKEITVRQCRDLSEALLATKTCDEVLVFGSLYLIGEVLHVFSNTNRCFGGFGIDAECDQR